MISFNKNKIIYQFYKGVHVVLCDELCGFNGV